MSDQAAGTRPPSERRNEFWRPLLAPDTEYENEPDDGHEHDYAAVAPKSWGGTIPSTERVR